MNKASHIAKMLATSFILGAPLYAKAPSVSNMPSIKNVQHSRNITAAKKLHYKKNEVIVKYKKNVSKYQIASRMRNANLNITKTYKALSKVSGHIYSVINSKALSTEELLERMENDPTVEYVEPNYVYYPAALPNDPNFNKLWGLNNEAQNVNGTQGKYDSDIDAPEAWDKSTGTEDVVIAVLDTGVDYKHEDLKDNMWVNPKEIPGNGLDDDNNGYIDDIYGIDAVNDTGDPMDLLIDSGGHGTHIAGIIAATGNNDKGVTGVSWKSKIMALKFISYDGGYTDDIIQCLDYVIAQKQAGVNIVATNNSWSGGNYSIALQEAIAKSNEAGILFIATAGNSAKNNDEQPDFPSSYDLTGVLSVTATNQDDLFPLSANYGKISIDLAAPGTNIYSTAIRSFSPQPNNIFFDDLENGLDNWTPGGDNTDWNITTDQELFEKPEFPVPSPTHFLSDSPGVKYPSDQKWWIALNHDIDLSAHSDEELHIGFGSAVNLQFDSNGNITDYANIEVSNDSGATWKPLFNMGVYTRYWYSPYTIKIPAEYKTANFRLRFLMESQTNTDKPGWLIDDIGIGPVNSQYEFRNGTSMATAMVSGAIALRASVCKEDTLQQLKEDILNTVDKKDILSEKVKSGGRLNVTNVMKMKCAADRVIPVVPMTMAPIYYLLMN